MGAFDTSAEALTKTIFAPTDDSVFFTKFHPDSIIVIYDQFRSTNHSQYHCGIYPHQHGLAKPLISSDGWCVDTLAGTAVTRIEPGSYSLLEPKAGDCRHLSYADCKTLFDLGLAEMEFTVTDATLYSCNGHGWAHPSLGTLLLEGPAAPVLRLTVDLFDEKDYPNVRSLTVGDILPPVVKLSRYDDDTGQPVDVTHMLSRAGRNQFRFDAATGHWNAALDTSLVSTRGRYFASAVAGDPSYLFEPGCSWLFTRE